MHEIADKLRQAPFVLGSSERVSPQTGRPELGEGFQGERIGR